MMVWEVHGSMREVDYAYRYCLGSTAIFYLFDLSDAKSFAGLQKWVEITETCQPSTLTRHPFSDRLQGRPDPCGP